jgi:transposase-like protein/IS1 family transposase
LAAKGQVNCLCCKSDEVKKSGSYQNKNRSVQRFFCLRCGKSFSESQPLDGIRTNFEQAAKVVHLLSETMGLRAISRFTGYDLKTIHRILESAGEHCARFLDAKIRNIKVPFVQADEVFSYIQQKPNGKNEADPNRGSMWTFLSIAKDEKLIINYRVGKRTGDEAQEFLADLGSRMSGRFQLTTDAFRGYVATSGSNGAVKNILGDKCEYATETKHIKSDPHASGDRIYFAPKLVKVHRTPRFGNPDMDLATICHCERTNLSLRTLTRRFVRKTINFSKKTENHRHAVAIFCATFNFCRIHKTLEGKTPAMAAGLTDHVWTIGELLSAPI